MSIWLHLLGLQFWVLGIAVAVLLLDVLFAIPGRLLGHLAGLGLLALLVGSFWVHGGGVAPHGVFVAGPFGLFFDRVFLAAGALSILGTIDWLARTARYRQAEYYTLLLLSLVGMMLLPGARDWILLVVAFELMGVPLYVLSAWAKNDVEPKLAAEAALKLFVTGAASSGFTLFGVALVTGLAGTTHLGGLPPSPLAELGMAMVIAGMAFKVGAVPFHFWVPDTYQGAPTPFVAFLSVAPKAGGLAALAVVLHFGFAAQARAWVPALIFLAAASMLVGNFFALPQRDVRRLLGFSGVAQIGYALCALCADSAYGLGMALFFIAAYVFTNLGVFLVVHAAAEGSGGHQLDQLAGLARRSPWLGAAMLVFLLSLAGIPFAVGFWGKLFVFLAAYRAGMTALVVAGVVLAIVGLFYYLQVARSTFMADGSSDAVLRTPAPLAAAIVVCLVAVLGLGLWPGPLLGQAAHAADSLYAANPTAEVTHVR